MKKSQIQQLVAIIVALMIVSFSMGFFLSRNDSSVDQALKQIAAEQKISSSELERAAIEGMLRASGDRWSNYRDSAEVAVESDELAGSYSGIGIWLRPGNGGGTEIAGIKSGSIADRSGLKVGDVIALINDADFSSANLPATLEALRGEPGTKLTIKVLRNGLENDFEFLREKYDTSDVNVKELAPNVALIRIEAFSEQVVAEVIAGLSKVGYKKGIVIDLRNNPGGVLGVATDFTQLFIRSGLLVSYDRGSGKRIAIEADNKSPISVPVAVIVNENTASSAEVVAGALQDRNRGVVIGVQTFGKGSVQESVTLSNGASLETTVGKFRTPSGRFIDKKGITPDVIASERESVKRSIEIIQALNAINDPVKGS
jgi:carboxyl-terminal processing protease